MSEPDLLTSGRERGPGGGRRPATALVLVAAVALAGAGVLLTRGGDDPAPPPRPTPSAGRTVPAGPTAVPPGRIVLSDDRDLSTTVAVGHVLRTDGGTVDAGLVREVLMTAAGQIGASSAVVAAPPGPDVLQVAFDRRLEAAAARAFQEALEQLPGTTGYVSEEPGTAVDVSVPLLPGGPCAPEAGEPGAAPDLSRLSSLSFEQWLPYFDLGSIGDLVVLSYVGPARTSDQLASAASSLARLCGVRIDDVRLTRHSGPLS